MRHHCILSDEPAWAATCRGGVESGVRQARRLVLKLSKSGSGVWSPFPLSLDQNLEVLTPQNIQKKKRQKKKKKKKKEKRIEEEKEEEKEEKEKKKETEPEVSEIKSLKIIARLLTKEDIAQRKLPNQTTGLVITNIAKSSPVNYLSVNDIIVEAQKKKIRSIKDLEDIVDKALKSNQKTILIVIYNSQNQRRYIGVKLD